MRPGSHSSRMKTGARHTTENCKVTEEARLGLNLRLGWPTQEQCESESAANRVTQYLRGHWRNVQLTWAPGEGQSLWQPQCWRFYFCLLNAYGMHVHVVRTVHDISPMGMHRVLLAYCRKCVPGALYMQGPLRPRLSTSGRLLNLLAN